MKAHQCYHCKQWVEEDEAHDCWTTTEKALTQELSEDLQEAYQHIREAAVELGEQRIYASHSSIMFSRKACHFFVRPKRKHLEGGAANYGLDAGRLRTPGQAAEGPKAETLTGGLVAPASRPGRSGRHRRRRTARYLSIGIRSPRLFFLDLSRVSHAADLSNSAPTSVPRRSSSSV